jgi:uncharacterized membrane protein
VEELGEYTGLRRSPVFYHSSSIVEDLPVEAIESCQPRQSRSCLTFIAASSRIYFWVFEMTRETPTPSSAFFAVTGLKNPTCCQFVSLLLYLVLVSDIVLFRLVWSGRFCSYCSATIGLAPVRVKTPTTRNVTTKSP